jgi:hypothetical protein
MRLLTLTCTAVLVLGLAACSAPTDDTGTDAPAPSDTQPTEPEMDAGGDECGGLTTQDLADIFGVELEGPEPSTGDSDQNGVTWTSTGCDWENEALELEIDLDISVASDFPDGTINCIEPGGVGDVTAVEGIGNQAWWKFDDFNEVEGELRACTDDQLVELAVDAQSGSMTPDELLEKAQSAVRVVTG